MADAVDGTAAVRAEQGEGTAAAGEAAEEGKSREGSEDEPDPHATAEAMRIKRNA